MAALVCTSPTLAGFEREQEPDWGFIDFNDSKPGIQSAAFREPADIWVTLPANMSAEAQAAFILGADLWDATLLNIEIHFQPPESGPPPAGAAIIEVRIRNTPFPGDQSARTTPLYSFAGNNQSGVMTGAIIEIYVGVLGNRNFVQSIGQHEMGHSLGLDEAARDPGTVDRIYIMDPGFEGGYPLQHLDSRDIAALAGRYTVPTPGAAALLGIGGLIAVRRRR